MKAKEFFLNNLKYAPREEQKEIKEALDHMVEAPASHLDTKTEVVLVYFPVNPEKFMAPGMPAMAFESEEAPFVLINYNKPTQDFYKINYKLFQDLVSHEIGHIVRGPITWADPNKIKRPTDLAEIYLHEEQEINRRWAPILYENYEKIKTDPSATESLIIGGILGLALNPKYMKKVKELTEKRELWEEYPNALEFALGLYRGYESRNSS